MRKEMYLSNVFSKQEVCLEAVKNSHKVALLSKLVCLRMLGNLSRNPPELACRVSLTLSLRLRNRVAAVIAQCNMEFYRVAL